MRQDCLRGRGEEAGRETAVQRSHGRLYCCSDSFQIAAMCLHFCCFTFVGQAPVVRTAVCAPEHIRKTAEPEYRTLQPHTRLAPVFGKVVFLKRGVLHGFSAINYGAILNFLLCSISFMFLASVARSLQNCLWLWRT